MGNTPHIRRKLVELFNQSSDSILFLEEVVRYPHIEHTHEGVRYFMDRLVEEGVLEKKRRESGGTAYWMADEGRELLGTE